MSIAQLRRRADALENWRGPAGQVSLTLEEVCRGLWRMDKRLCEKMSREGDRSMGFYIGQFKAEEALARRSPMK